jgi:hypothetical protein
MPHLLYFALLIMPKDKGGKYNQTCRTFAQGYEAHSNE